MGDMKKYSFVVLVLALCSCVMRVDGQKSYIQELHTKAERGDAEAQHSLGWMYEKGEDVPQNYTEAVKWYRKAAEQGDASGQSSLGLMYLQGRDVPENKELFHMWYLLSMTGKNSKIERIASIKKTASEIRDLADMIGGKKLTQTEHAMLVKAEAMAIRCFQSGYKACG
jgi:TPR repeat protein